MEGKSVPASRGAVRSGEVHQRAGVPAGAAEGVVPPDPMAGLIAGLVSGEGVLTGSMEADGPLLPGVALPDGLASKVLVLNRAFVAIRVVSARQAFCLLARDAAEVIHDDNGVYSNYDFESWTQMSELRKTFEPEKHDWVRTVRLEIAVPRIIRLLGYDRLPDAGVKLNRRNLFARDRNQCQYCGHFFPTNELSIDHVKPRSQGGPDTWENLVCACVRCNARKGGRTPEQARMKMVRRPVRPKRNPLIAIRLGHEKYASWKAFLDEAYWSVELG
jgi:5-methylcytosine-specific restriction endonuclease McrA